MATRTLTIQRIGRGGRIAFTNLIATPGVPADPPLLNGDQTAPMDISDVRPEIAWQVLGTLGAGGSIQLEKSNDGVAWTIVGAGVVALSTVDALTAARFVRFNVTAGDGTTSLSVILCVTPQAVAG